MSTATRPLTYDDLAAMPDDGKRYELVEGGLVELTSPLRVHQELVRLLFRLLDRFLDRFVEAGRLGRVYVAPVDVVLSPDNVLQPDLLFIAQDRLHIFNRAYVEEPPDLVVEILSPSTGARDRTIKAELYARFGVREYWMVDPETRGLTILVLGAAGYAPSPMAGDVVRSTVLPGLAVNVRDLFAAID